MTAHTNTQDGVAGRKHTPTPWRKDGEQFGPGASIGTKEIVQYLVGGKDGENPTIFISSTVSNGKDAKQFQANVDLILAAVNEREALLAANAELKRALEEIGAINFGQFLSPQHAAEHARKVARAALTAAQSEKEASLKFKNENQRREYYAIKSAIEKMGAPRAEFDKACDEAQAVLDELKAYRAAQSGEGDAK